MGVRGGEAEGRSQRESGGREIGGGDVEEEKLEGEKRRERRKQCCGSGSGIRDWVPFYPWIRDPGSWMGESQHQDPGSGMNNPDHIF